MSRKDVGSRRLNLQAALGFALRSLPGLWMGAAGALVVCAAVWLVPMLWAPGGWARGLWVFAAAMATLIAFGALARLAVSADASEARGRGLGPLGLQLGLAEARLFGAALLCLIFLAMVVSVLGLVVLAIFGVAELDVAAIQARDWPAVGAPWKLAILALVGVGALFIPLLLIVRLSLFPAATIGRGQMVSLNSMGIAYGSFWPLLAGLIVMALPAIALSALISGGELTGRLAAVAWVVGLVAIQLPLTLAFVGGAYRQLEYWFPDEPTP